MIVRFRFQFLHQCTVEVESNVFDSLQQCLDDIHTEIERLEDCLLKRALQDQFSVLLKKFQEVNSKC